ncbi:isoprenylcysteine carboxylmethyltransferase family protein [uncultured Winogradskyella sp.]|uniref:methyltransferase family protein n=1 Tax=uncultured Winogradskyella sp. TaxID=395353 RepID=UPI002636DFC2|nr:isoprenylcysteine carboxylmethyltransferase family protein [uncultured Winogradskyella sp.]
MLSLFIRNLFFTILQPGLVAGLIPLWIIGFRISNIFDKVWQLHNYIGIIVFLIGFLIMFWCIISFAIYGRGTLSPVDPTKKLVTSGLYCFSRNPMYVGVILILIGEAVFFKSIELWIYSLLVFIAFYIFILLIEEPRLRKDFGEEYKTYCKKVRRWV